MDETKRESLLRRIKALLAKTVENGCTEGEAMVAAEKVAAMMAEHDLGMSDVELAASKFEERSRRVHDDIGWRLWKIAKAIDELCGTRSYTDRHGIDARRISFFGREDDVAVAGYILDIAENALRSSTSSHERLNALYVPAIRRRKRLSFIDGMIESMVDSIQRIAWARNRPDAAGKGIVVSKKALVEAEMKLRKIDLRTRPGGLDYDFDDSHGQGRIEGDRVRFEAGLDAEDVAVSGLLGHGAD